MEKKPKPIVSLVPRNGGSKLVGDAARRGSEVAGERWRRKNYLNKFASTYRGAGPVSCKNELQSTDNKLGEDRRSACRMKLQVGDSVAQLRIAADHIEFDQASPVGSSAVAGTRSGMTTVDYPPPKPVIPCYDGDPLMLTALGWTLFGVGSSAQDENRCLYVSSLSDDELCVSPYDNVISCGLE